MGPPLCTPPADVCVRERGVRKVPVLIVSEWGLLNPTHSLTRGGKANRMGLHYTSLAHSLTHTHTGREGRSWWESRSWWDSVTRRERERERERGNHHDVCASACIQVFIRARVRACECVRERFGVFGWVGGSMRSCSCVRAGRCARLGASPLLPPGHSPRATPPRPYPHIHTTHAPRRLTLTTAPSRKHLERSLAHPP